ncbi:hypothetical protein F5Y19DRAFT_408381 [Xylariaceae sp. FL1651]|nr:hypothetical protein F5Y19DRAFT_408381 [Xylariaceae sp. FL1651]
MESWEGHNYYTTDPVIWVELMNYSTVEWGLGYFPQDIRALPGALNSSYNFSNETYVIEYAGRADSDNRATEKIVFGIVSAIAIAFALVWLCYNWKTLFQPRNANSGESLPRPNSPTSNHTAATELTPLQDNKFWGADDFKDQIFNFYYEPVYTEIEAYEKTLNDEIEPEDIEAVTDLVRKMYGLELLLLGHQNTRGFTEERGNELRSQNDAIQEEIRNRVKAWAGLHQSPLSRAGWNEEERKVLNRLVMFVDKPGPEQQPYQRH